MKIKVFTAISSWDASWTGGNVTTYDAYGIISDNINSFVEEHNLEIKKVDYSEIQSYTQHGNDPRNRDVYKKVIATLYYEGDLNIYKCIKCHETIVDKKEETCEECDVKERQEFWEHFHKKSVNL